MFRSLRHVLPLLPLLHAGCGGRENGASPSPSDGDAMTQDVGDAAPSSDATSALPDGSHIVPSGIVTKAAECQSPADCPSPNTDAICADVVPGGYRVCVSHAPVADKPSVNPSGDQCDGTRPCASGTCYEAAQYPSGQCGLGGVSIQNLCRSDGCSSDADCPGGICGPQGLTSENNVSGGYVRQCFHADCHSNADCAEHAQGVCAFVAGGCPTTLGFHMFHPAQLACVYPDGCFAIWIASKEAARSSEDPRFVS